MRKFLVGVLGSSLLALGLFTGGSASAAGANQKFVITETNNSSTFVGIGPISGEGVDHTLTSSDSEDGTFTETARTDFKDGSVYMSIQGTSASFNFNEKTCVGRFTGKGNFQVTGGTGAYDGATGSGTFTYRGSFTGCDEDSGSFSQIVRARGKVNLAGTGSTRASAVG